MVEAVLLIVAVIVTAFAVAVWRFSSHVAVNQRFVSFTAAVMCWVVGIAGAHGASRPQPWAAIAFAGAALIPATLLSLTRLYPIPSQWLPILVVRFVFGVGMLFSFASLFTNLVVFDTVVSAGTISRKTGPLYFPFAVYFVLVLIFAIATLFSKVPRARGLARAQLSYLGVGILIAAIGGIGNNLLLPLVTGDSSTSWLGPVFTLAYVGLAAHAIIRHRLMDLRVVIHRGLILAIATALSLSPMIVLASLFWSRLSSQVRSRDLLVFLAATILVALLVSPTKDMAVKLLDRYVYRTRANYQRTVRDAARMLTKVLNVRVLLPFLCRTVSDCTGSEGVAIYVSLHDTPTNRIQSVELSAPARVHRLSSFTACPAIPDIVLTILKRTKDVVVADEIARATGGEARELSETLSRLNWGLVLPVVFEDEVIGAIVLGPKLSGDPFYPQDLDLLMTLANQAGIALKNAQLYDQVVLANEYVENIVATIESGVVAIGVNGQIAMFNRAAERLTGVSARLAKGRSVSELPACLGDALLASVADGGAQTQPEVVLPGPGGSKPVICTTSPLRDPHGTILGAVAVFSDLTPLKDLEIERRRAEKLAYFEVLASGIAHEIKNPLVAIKTFAQLLPRRHSDSRFVDDFGRVVTREIARMEGLVERLQALSRPGERPSRPVDLRLPVRDAVETAQVSFSEKTVTIETHLGDEPVTVLGHHDELQQIFLNLLMNALDATPPGGGVAVTLTAEGDQASVSVADTGSGIPAALLDRLFDPFVTTKQHGAGLGLAICAGIARRHGARLTAANRPEGGALFRIDFPRAAVAAAILG